MASTGCGWRGGGLRLIVAKHRLPVWPPALKNLLTQEGFLKG